jgi:5-(carboxyamino)imidazole ribonucleotide mutase
MGEPSVGIIMGSQSDWPTLREAAAILDELGVAYEARIVSAHRTPDRLWEYGKTAAGPGPQGHHRGRGRGGASAGHDGVQDPGSRDRRAGSDQGALGRRLALFHRPDAARLPVATMAIGAGGGGECRAHGRRDPRHERRRIGRAARHWRAKLSASIPEAPSDD